MDQPNPNHAKPIEYPPGFRARRGLNWGFLGLLYTSFYMCRYNLSLANTSISEELGFTRADMGKIITTALLAYACGQVINGLICDKIGGKRSMLIGAAGTIVMNVLFGVASFWGLLWLFIAIRGIDGYLQAFGAPGMIKINTAWFAQRERGRFAGIYGFMINLGRFGISKLGPALLAGFTFLGMWTIPPLHWRWIFWIPSVICAVVAVGMALTVKETPEAAGFHDTHAAEPKSAENEREPSLQDLLLKMVKHPTIWIVAAAYACTGAVRQSLDQWWPRYLTDVWQIAFDTKWHFHLWARNFEWNAFAVVGFLIPFVSSAGSLISGYLSDTVFKGRRAPVAAGIYFLETGMIVLAIVLLGTHFHKASAAVFFVLLISFTANSTHSLLGTAAAMDIGGRKQAGLASGIIDSFQYFGGSLAGYVLGRLLDQSWDWYFYFMAPFGIIGGVLMLLSQGGIKPQTQAVPAAMPGPQKSDQPSRQSRTAWASLRGWYGFCKKFRPSCKTMSLPTTARL